MPPPRDVLAVACFILVLWPLLALLQVVTQPTTTAILTMPSLSMTPSPTARLSGPNPPPFTPPSLPKASDFRTLTPTVLDSLRPIYATSSGIIRKMLHKTGTKVRINAKVALLQDHYFHELLFTASGTVFKWKVHQGASVQVGDVLGWIHPDPKIDDDVLQLSGTDSLLPLNPACKFEDLHPDKLLARASDCIPSTMMDNVTVPPDYFSYPPKDDQFDCSNGSLRVATSADSHYFPNLLNLIGSIHHWEPLVQIVVYDMGFTHDQRRTLLHIENVQLRRLPFERLPHHFSLIHTYAFKPFLFFDALRTFPEPCVLWQDAGQEFRQRIDSIRDILHDKGAFLIDNGFSHPTVFTNLRHVAYFGLSPTQYFQATLREKMDPKFQGLKEVAAGIIGATRNPDLLHRLWLPWLTCAYRRTCISPESTNRLNDRQDQTALNMILYYIRWPGDRNKTDLYIEHRGQTVSLLPTSNTYTMYSLESCCGRGNQIQLADPDVIIPDVVLYSRKQYPVLPATNIPAGEQRIPGSHGPYITPYAKYVRFKI